MPEIKRLKQLVHESLVYGFSGILSRFVGFFLIPVYARVFSPQDYGAISLVTTTFAIVTIFVVLGLDSAAHRWYWDGKGITDQKATIASWTWCQTVVSLVFAAIIFLFSDHLANGILHDRHAGIYFRIMSLTLPLGVLGTVVTNWLRMQRRPWAVSIFSVLMSVFTITVTIVLVVVLKLGLLGVFLSQALSALFSTGIAVYLLRDWMKISDFQWSRLIEMLRFCYPLIPSALATWVVGFSGRYFVEYYADKSEVGLYHVGASIALLMTLLIGAFQQAWGPFSMSIHKNADSGEVYAQTLTFYMFFGLLASTALSLFAPEILLLLATERYMGASPVIGILAMSAVFNGLTYIAATGATLAKKTWPIGAAIILAAIINIILNIMLVPRYGKMGAAVSTLLSQAFMPICLFAWSQRIYPIAYRFGRVIVLVIGSLCLMGLGAYMQPANPWLGILEKSALLLAFIPAAAFLRLRIS